MSRLRTMHPEWNAARLVRFFPSSEVGAASDRHLRLAGTASPRAPRRCSRDKCRYVQYGAALGDTHLRKCHYVQYKGLG